MNAQAINLGASTVSGNLDATAAAGGLTDSGLVTVLGTAAFETAANDQAITLGTLAVTGAIDLTTVTAGGNTGHATIVNATAVNLAASTVSGNLDVTAILFAG